ncbi:MAG: esterase-like activity of phytase family protein, partial [Spongiibacteraceae bacterium]
MMFKPQNNNRLIWAPLVAAIALTAACSGSNSSSSGFTGTDLASKNFAVDEALATVSFTGGKTLSLTLSAGSGAYQAPSEDFEDFYTVSDRGPSIDCADTEIVIEVADFCGVGVSGEVFPLPAYAPQITHWQLSGQGSELSLEKVSTITLSDSAGADIDGLPNSADEKAFGPDGNALAVSANGLDPEAIVKLANGNFWLADDYGPSLVLVAADGKILERHVPAGTLADYSGATYPVSDTLLPAVFAKRQQQGGISALALSPDNQFLYFIMKRPLANPDEESVADSRVVRIGKLSLDEDGAISAMTGEYLYRLYSPLHFSNKHDSSGDLVDGEFLPQSVVKINEAVALAEDYLAVVEQADTVSKFYRINLANAVSVLDSAWDSSVTSPSLEQQYLVVDAPFVPKQLAFDSLSWTLPVGINALPTAIEGLAFLNGNFTVHSNDNNYGIAGGSSELTVLPLGALIAIADTPLMPSLDYANSASFKRDDAVFDGGSAGDLAIDVVNAQMFVANAQLVAVDVVDVADPLTPTLVGQLDLAAAATDAGITIGAVNSVVVGLSHVAVALENSDPQASGSVALFALDDLSFSASFEVGAMPRALAFDFLGRYVLVANEGAPSDDYSVDPEGSVSVIDISDGVDVATVTSISFDDFNVDGTRADELSAEVRVTGPDASVAQDLEPEFITVALDN